MQTSRDLNVVGQFYSLYLVAGYVEVITKHSDGKQYVWDFKADGALVISWNEPLRPATEIRLHLRDACCMICLPDEFINSSVYMRVSKAIAVDGEDKAEKGEENPKSEIVQETANESKISALWLRKFDEDGREE